jgi:hypothetical protein
MKQFFANMDTPGMVRYLFLGGLILLCLVGLVRGQTIVPATIDEVAREQIRGLERRVDSQEAIQVASRVAILEANQRAMLENQKSSQQKQDLSLIALIGFGVFSGDAVRRQRALMKSMGVRQE